MVEDLGKKNRNQILEDRLTIGSTSPVRTSSETPSGKFPPIVPPEKYLRSDNLGPRLQEVGLPRSVWSFSTGVHSLATEWREGTARRTRAASFGGPL